MIYLFYGSDVDKTRAKAFEWVTKARAKEPNLTYQRLAQEDLSANVFNEIAANNSLFAKRTLTLIDDPYVGRATSNNGEEGERGVVGESVSVLDEYIDLLAESENAIVILAPRLLASRAKKLAAKAKMSYEFNLRVAPARERGFNASLVNALGARDAKKLWLEVVRALRKGDAPEMLHGLLHWKARDLMEKGSPKWKPAEARTLSIALISLLQDCRREGLDLSESLERFALSV